jgi:hypothetical protein
VCCCSVTIAQHCSALWHWLTPNGLLQFTHRPTSSPHAQAWNSSRIQGFLASFLSKVALLVLVAIATLAPQLRKCSSSRLAPGSGLTSAHLHSSNMLSMRFCGANFSMKCQQLAAAAALHPAAAAHQPTCTVAESIRASDTLAWLLAACICHLGATAAQVLQQPPRPRQGPYIGPPAQQHDAQDEIVRC